MEGNEVLSSKIKGMSIKQFTHLQMITLSEKVHITEDGKKIVYFDLNDVLNYYNLPQTNEDSRKLCISYNKLSEICSHFIELEAKLFKEISEGSEFAENFFSSNFNSIIDFYFNNNLSNKEGDLLKDFIVRASHYMRKNQNSWTELTINNLIELRRNNYNLSNYEDYLKEVNN